MTQENGRQLNLAADMYGCPNRCRHCWIGHMPNTPMPEGSDRRIVDFFSPFFGKIAFYSWLREPDYCEDYRGRWFRDLAVSKNAKPQRYELASFYRIVRDERYIPFLKEVGVKKVQLTFFGLEATQDRYVGRKGAFREVMRATDLLVRNGIVPRWQCFLNEENTGEILRLQALAEEKKRSECPGLEFFVHEGSCDGENRKLYPVRIRKSHIPEVLIPVYYGYDKLLTEQECVERLRDLDEHPVFLPEGDLTLYISNTFDVFYNLTHMTAPWAIGSLLTERPEALVRRILDGDTPALRRAARVTWADLSRRFGNSASQRAFSLEDYRMYLFNAYLEQPAP